MHKRPLAVIALFFIFGIVSGRFLPDSVTLFHIFVVTLIFITLTLTLSLKRGREAHVFLFLSIVSVGALLYLNSNIFPSNHISYFLGKDKVKADKVIQWLGHDGLMLKKHNIIAEEAENGGANIGSLIFKFRDPDNTKIRINIVRP